MARKKGAMLKNPAKKFVDRAIQQALSGDVRAAGLSLSSAIRHKVKLSLIEQYVREVYDDKTWRLLDVARARNAAGDGVLATDRDAEDNSSTLVWPPSGRRHGTSGRQSPTRRRVRAA